MKTKSLHAKTHQVFWEAIASKYLENVEHGHIKDAFIGYVILDWVNDINTELINQPEEILNIWYSFEQYDKWLLRSMLNPERIIKQIEIIYYENQKEIIEALGNDDPSYVNDFSVDFYLNNGIDVPA